MSSSNNVVGTADDEARARAFISEVEHLFTYAKSVPEAPHEYLIRARLSAEQQVEFDWLVALIERIGYRGPFWGSTWRYVDIGEFKFWTSREWHGDGPGVNGMLNRARIDSGQLRLELGGAA